MKHLKRQEAQSSLLETLFSDVGDCTFPPGLVPIVILAATLAGSYCYSCCCCFSGSWFDLCLASSPGPHTFCCSPSIAEKFCLRSHPGEKHLCEAWKAEEKQKLSFLQQCRHRRRFIATSIILLQITTPVQQVGVRPQEFL